MKYVLIISLILAMIPLSIIAVGLAIVDVLKFYEKIYNYKQKKSRINNRGNSSKSPQ